MSKLGRHFETWKKTCAACTDTLDNVMLRASCGHESVEHGQWDVNRINIPFYWRAKLFPVPPGIGESETIRVHAILPQRHCYHPSVERERGGEGETGG